MASQPAIAQVVLPRMRMAHDALAPTSPVLTAAPVPMDQRLAADSAQLLLQEHVLVVQVNANAAHVRKDAKSNYRKGFALTTECEAFLVERLLPDLPACACLPEAVPFGGWFEFLAQHGSRMPNTLL